MKTSVIQKGRDNMFEKIKSILYIRPQSIEMYTISTIEVQKVSFPKDVFEGVAIKNPEKFKELFVEFLAKLPFGAQRIRVVLADGVFFQKKFVVDTELTAKLEEFYQKVPIDQGKLARKTIETKTAVYGLAANKEIYEVTAYILEEQGWHVDGVVPLTLYTDGKEEAVLSKEEIVHIIQDKKRMLIGNFLQKTTTRRFPWKLSALVLVAGLFCIGGIFLFRMLSSPVKKEVVTPVVTVPTPTNIPAIAKKEEISIVVKNGTGVAGQAGRVKERLEKLGFTSITTGNSDTKTAEETIITYNKSVSDVIKKEIKEDLENMFTSVVEKQADGSESTIEILTGKYASQ